MNVIIANKYRDALANLDIEVIKKLEGEFTVDEIIETFKNFFFQKMILDITALKDYKNIKTLQQLSLSLDMDRLILLLDGSPETSDPEYLSDLISMRIYNFTMNVEGVKWLYEHPNSYRDVAQYHQLDTTHETNYINSATPQSQVYPEIKQTTVICFKDITPGAGATTLTYIAKKQLARNYDVVAIEVDKHDFMYFDEDKMYSVSSNELGNTISKYNSAEVVLIDGNTSPVTEALANETIYLLEPSKIQLNKLLARDPKVLENNKNKKVVLNQCMLSNQDISDFEYETGLSVFATIPPLNDQSSDNEALDRFLVKLGFYKQTPLEQGGNKKGLMGLFK
ncbi:unknown [Firmicutes bacterium CAG:822]|nr:unknown [Firmicutes bacterium CAG:822]